ncbi:error-prone DNA polymerase [Ferrimonas sediminicola]|uniref:Error-prone DNA polymerase n=1 Tax=Ferrimonas sediminicola TaxID=2569538 RepID=A0A4U1BGB6_9GAMM|nr:error-prone DNA polymerase [Ferrimonas sediminicola]TKB50245.1 error-prone DNA polymerase [Ferrimonas sediminicola]
MAGSEPGYAELHCLSNYSFLQGASHPAELVAQAASLGYDAIALTDECSLAGIVKAWEAAREHGIKLITGCEFRFGEATLVVLAQSRRGYGRLSALITQARRRSPKGEYVIHWSDLAPGLEECLLLLRPVAGTERARLDPILATLVPLYRGRLWLLVERHFAPDDATTLALTEALGQRWSVPLVCAGGVRMHDVTRQPLLDLLCCVHHGCTLAQAGWRLEGNREAHLKSLEALGRRYRREWLAQTQVIAELCRFELGELRYQYPAEVVPAGLSASRYLRQETEAGARRRYPDGVPERVAAQIERELQLIDELEYHYFFLTIYDIVRFARTRKILYQGRGSAANSVVCYCLGITEVDPTQVNLLFERFISRERNEPPDIDVDFEHQRREEVIQYIYGKYGRERAALAATVISYRFKSAVRDVGKALGLDESYQERLIKQVDRRDKDTTWQSQTQALIGEEGVPAGAAAHLVPLVESLIGFPRHLSQHVGGFIISQGPLAELVPVENAAMADRTVIQWDKDDLETLGLLKVDVLALGMLTAIRRCFDLIGQWRGQPYGMDDVQREQPQVYDMLCRADSIGVFQIESRAQSNMLPRLRPRSYYDLVIQIAIVRPGPIQGEMVHPYLRRRHGLEPVSYPSEAVREVLERTLGVPIFQEQVIKLAMVAAGFSGGEADRLRRAMASWKRHGELDKFETKLLSGMAERGYSEAFARQVFNQIRGFGEYGFPESHSASFALLAYVSAYLKYHHPAAFCCALLNSQPMGFYTPSQLVQDLRRHGVSVLPVSVNHSGWDHRLESVAGEAGLRLGLRLVKGLCEEAGRAVVCARPEGGYRDSQQLASLSALGRPDLERLAAADALRSMVGHRYQARWQLAAVMEQLPLFGEEPPQSQVTLAAPEAEEEMLTDFTQLGLTLGEHPMSMLRRRGLMKGQVNAEQLMGCRQGQPVTLTGVVVGRQRPGTASGVTFITLEDETGNANVVVWSRTAQAQRQPYLTARLMQVSGKVEKGEGVVHLMAGRLLDRSELFDNFRVKSRNFR